MFQTLSSADLVKTLEAKHINIDEMHCTDVHAIIAAQKETVVKGTATDDGKVPETYLHERNSTCNNTSSTSCTQRLK